MDKEFFALQSKYPEIVTLEQLYQICHISKRKAKWLLDNGIIPCEDSGKKTRRYKIKLSDIIAYLQNEEKQRQVPIGKFASQSKRPKQPKPREVEPEAFSLFLIQLWKDEPDVMSYKDIMRLTGYSYHTIQTWTARKRIAPILYNNKRLFIKQDIIRHVSSIMDRNINFQSANILALKAKFLQEQLKNSQEAPNSAEVRSKMVVAFCSQARTRKEIQNLLGLSDRKYVMKSIIRPLLDKGLLQMTIPEQPGHINQQYVAKPK